MKYAIAPAPVYSLAIAGQEDQFPVNRVFCVGRNYAAHAREMGKDPEREAPFFFMKPADAIIASGSTISYPQITKDLHHEIEMTVARTPQRHARLPLAQFAKYCVNTWATHSGRHGYRCDSAVSERACLKRRCHATLSFVEVGEQYRELLFQTLMKLHVFIMPPVRLNVKLI